MLKYGPNMNGSRFPAMPHDPDYYRARAMEERESARQADRVYLSKLHRQLAEHLDRRAEECDSRAEEFDELAERASDAIRKRGR